MAEMSHCQDCNFSVICEFKWIGDSDSGKDPDGQTDSTGRREGESGTGGTYEVLQISGVGRSFGGAADVLATLAGAGCGGNRSWWSASGLRLRLLRLLPLRLRALRLLWA